MSYVVVAAFTTVFFWFKNWYCDDFFVEPIPKITKLTIKIRKCVIFSLYYTLTFGWFFNITQTVPWFDDAVECALVTKGHMMEENIRLFFDVQLGFYLAGLFELTRQQSRDRAKDWTIMVIHHTVTAMLIVACKKFGAYWIGVYVIGLHDAADIFLYASDALHTWTKLTKIKEHSHKSALCTENIKTGLFITFALVFVYTRLYLFGFKFVFGTCTSHIWVLGKQPAMLGMWIGMGALTLMHVYWFTLICRMIYNTMNGKVLEDAREKDK